MEKSVISKSFYYVKTRDRIGRTVETNVFQMESGVFRAYSVYIQNEDKLIIGFGESYNDEEAMELSLNDLKRNSLAQVDI